MKKTAGIGPRKWRILLVWFAVTIGLAADPAAGAEGMAEDAKGILKAMSSYMSELNAFKMNADIHFEILTQNGQKLQISSMAAIIVERPSKLHVIRKGILADAEFIYDGNQLTLHGKNINAYAQIKKTGTIDDAIRAYEMETGIPAPGADLLFSEPYAILSSGVEQSTHIGTTYVDGVECHHLAFRESKVDWQIWVKTGNEPLPMKYVITSKWQTGAPQYEIRLRNWNTTPVIKTDQFSFQVPKGARRLNTMAVNELGELKSTKEGQ